MGVVGCWVLQCCSQSGSDLVGLPVLETWPVHSSHLVAGAKPQGSYTWPHGRGQPFCVGGRMAGACGSTPTCPVPGPRTQERRLC